METTPFPWAHLDAIEVARIEALPFEAALYALLDCARPRASAKDLEDLDWPAPKPQRAAFKRILAEWKASRALGNTPDTDGDAQINLPARVRLTQMLHAAIELKDTAEILKLASALERLNKAGQEAPPTTTEDWSRLSDLKSGVLVALVRELNGEPQTENDAAWLAHAGIQ